MAGYHLETRIGETCGIDLLSDLDLNREELRISHQLTKENGTWFYRTPKYDSCRTLKIGPTLKKALKEKLLTRKKYMMKYGPYYTKTYLLPDGICHQPVKFVHGLNFRGQNVDKTDFQATQNAENPCIYRLKRHTHSTYSPLSKPTLKSFPIIDTNSSVQSLNYALNHFIESSIQIQFLLLPYCIHQSGFLYQFY